MTDVNKVLLLGNLVRDPELRPLGTESKVCELRIAMNRQFTDRQGNAKEEVCYVDIDVYNGQADACAAALGKGAQVFVEGRLKLDQWEDRNSGKRQSRLKVVGDRVVFLSARREPAAGAPGAAPGAASAGGCAAPAPAAPRAGGTPVAPAAGANRSSGRVWRRDGPAAA